MKNVGMIDRIIRVIIAIVGATLFFTHTVEGVAGWVIVGVSAVMLFTALISYCPLYAIFRITSSGKK